MIISHSDRLELVLLNLRCFVSGVPSSTNRATAHVAAYVMLGSDDDRIMWDVNNRYAGWMRSVLHMGRTIMRCIETEQTWAVHISHLLRQVVAV